MVMITLGPARSRLLERIAAPTSEPLTLAETKLYLRVDGSEEDSLIGDMITSARMMAEQWLRRSLMTQGWKLTYDYGTPECVWLPMGPVASVDSVVVTPCGGGAITLVTGQFRLNAARDRLWLLDGFCEGKVEISYTAGFGDASAVPKPIKQGMLAHVAQLYESRGEGVAEPFPAQSAGLYLPFREVRL